MLVTKAAQRSALASPLRLEILGLFTNPAPLAISDMARLMGRTAGSLYHHVGLLEKAGLLRRAGTRPAGKRHEALFAPVAERIEVAVEAGDTESVDHIVKALSAAFRMAERDLDAALMNPDSRTEGPERNLFATRMHMHVSPRILARINKHLDAITDILAAESARKREPAAEDEHLSLTMALLPLKGRRQRGTPQGEKNE